MEREDILKLFDDHFNGVIKTLEEADHVLKINIGSSIEELIVMEVDEAIREINLCSLVANESHDDMLDDLYIDKNYCDVCGNGGCICCEPHRFI